MVIRKTCDRVKIQVSARVVRCHGYIGFLAGLKPVDILNVPWISVNLSYRHIPVKWPALNIDSFSCQLVKRILFLENWPPSKYIGTPGRWVDEYIAIWKLSH
jgi:hypothetical protein